jgi:hypothetical protein
MRHSFCLLLLLLLPLISLAGCGGPALSKTDLGTVIFQIPEVPGADTPYRIPQLQGEPEPGKQHLTQHLPSPPSSV